MRISDYLRESCSLNQKNLDRVKAIEKIAYPSHMQFYGDFDDIDDVIDYADCDGQIDCIVQDDWYAIFCNGPREVEVIDLAARRSLSLSDLLVIYQKMTSFGNKIFTMNARASTSYRLIKLGEKRGMFEILLDEPNSLNGEPMHEIEFRIKPRNTFKEWFYITEALDANTKNLLVKAKAPKDQLDAFIKELEDEPNLIDNKTAFQRFQAKFNIQKKEKPKDEDAQRKHFATIPNTTEEELQTYDHYKKESPRSLKEMMELLRKFIEKKLITLKIENKVPNLHRNTLQGSQKIDTPDFTRFMSSLHGIQASLEQYKGKGKYFNPIEEELNHQQNLVAKGDNIWVFKGHAPDVCRIYGKGHPWCISSSTSAAYWFTYRIKHHQTQYFVFDYNKEEDDPARYVNPGVAPEGMYSEWVDSENDHSEDPEDSESQVGINGYNSINQYKKYLVSKGIPESIWTTTPPEDWEERLHLYDEDNDFTSAKNDKHPEVFPMYLKIANEIKDSDFDTLNDEQKKEFILSKDIDYLTEKQLDYVMGNFKGEYYNSLDLDGKIRFAIRANDQDSFLKLAENPKLSDENVRTLLYRATDKDKIAKIIIEKQPKLSNDNVRYLFLNANEPDKIAKILGKDKLETFNWLSVSDAHDFISSSSNKEKMIDTIFKYKKNLDIDQIYNMLLGIFEPDKIAEIIIKRKELLHYKLSSNQFFELLINKAVDKEKVAELLGDDINEISDEHVESLISNSQFQRQLAGKDEKNSIDQMSEIIIKYKTKLSNNNVYNLFGGNNRQKIASLLKKQIHRINDISSSSIAKLLSYSNDKNEMVEELGANNISKISDEHIGILLDLATDKKQMAQIINQYHKKITPEIQEILDKYLNEL